MLITASNFPRVASDDAARSAPGYQRAAGDTTRHRPRMRGAIGSPSDLTFTTSPYSGPAALHGPVSVVGVHPKSGNSFASRPGRSAPAPGKGGKKYEITRTLFSKARASVLAEARHRTHTVCPRAAIENRTNLSAFRWFPTTRATRRRARRRRRSPKPFSAPRVRNCGPMVRSPAPSGTSS